MKIMNLSDEVEEEQFQVHAKPISSKISSWKIYIVAVFVRLFVGLFLIRTFHKGDEFFQGPQVAHKMIFGTGQLSWEWVFKDPIRGPLFPGFYAIGFWIAKITGLDNFLSLFSSIPYIQQSFLAALYDLILVKINQKYNGAKSTYILLLFNWTGWTTLTYLSRTYVNSAETVITMTAFYFWLKRNENSKYDLYSRILASVGFVARGTSIIFWVIIWPYQLLRHHSQKIETAFKFIIKNIITVIGMISLSIIISSIYYGRLIWVDYNFFYYNLVLNWSKLAGVSDSTQYFVHYQYKIFNVAVVFLIFGIIQSLKPTKNHALSEKNKNFRELLGINIVCILFLSYNEHKQLRFLLVYIPYLLIFIVRGFEQIPFSAIKKLILLIFVGISIYQFVRRNFFIFNGQMEMVKYVRDNANIKNLYLLTGSFGMPMYCYIHRPINIKQVQYRYDDAMQNRKPQKQVFYQTPQYFLSQVLQKNPNLTHIITRKGQVQDFEMDKYNFDLEYQVRHPFFPGMALQYQLWRIADDQPQIVFSEKTQQTQQSKNLVLQNNIKNQNQAGSS